MQTGSFEIYIIYIKMFDESSNRSNPANQNP